MHNPFRYAEIGKWKDSINNSRSIAPYIGAVAGRIIDGYGNYRNLGFKIVKDSNDAKKAVDSMKSYGADFIKVYNHLTLSEYLAIAEEARRLHIPIAGHVPFGISLDTLVQAGQNTCLTCLITFLQMKFMYANVYRILFKEFQKLNLRN